MIKKTVLLLIFVLLTGTAFSEIPLSERYPGPWMSDFNVGISRALAKNDISGCGEYQFRSSAKNNNEYLVRCTSDGINWNLYIVWVGIDEVMGPYKSDPSLD